MKCLFCNIAQKKIPADIVYESATVVGFKDINPQAPEHILVIPKEHTESILTIDANNTSIKDLILAIQTIAKNSNHSENGFRVVSNCGTWGGQTVNHLHFHILIGRPLNWPPG